MKASRRSNGPTEAQPWHNPAAKGPAQAPARLIPLVIASDAPNIGLAGIFDFAAAVDPTVATTSAQLRRLASKQVTPTPYSHDAAFRAMAAGRIGLFSRLRVPVLGEESGETTAILSRAIDESFRETDAVRPMTGAAGVRRRMTVSDLLNKWRRDDAVVSITDLHIRETPLERVLDTRALSDFNILCRGSEDVAWHEMMTLVVSSAGAVTDSHSDDPDGTNHCFTGSKLWLVWNTFEGRRFGLEDIERDPVRQSAKFSIEQFLRVSSARWFVMSPGLTLFLPGDLTHKVITLRRYLGVGSFYLAAPNAVRTIARWLNHGPLWLNDGVRGNTRALIDEMAETALVTIERWRQKPTRQQRRLGLHMMRPSVRYWASAAPAATRARLRRHAAFRKLLAEASR